MSGDGRGSSGGATVSIDEQDLPTQVRFAPHLRGKEYESAFVDGYGAALMARIKERVSAGYAGTSRLPSRRACVLEYLNARTWDEFLALQSESFGRTFRAQSAVVDPAGSPAVVVVADESALTSLDISAEWADKAGPSVVAQEIVTCAGEIRTQRNSPKFHRDDGKLSDDELEAMLRAHLPSLLAQRGDFE